MPNQCKQPAAFTLVEMLLVAAVIVLLIGMLLPSLSKARAHSRNVVCQTQLHALGIAVESYSYDWRGKLFPYDNKTSLHYETFWMTLLEPYHGTFDQLRTCPETTLSAALQNTPQGAGWGSVKAAWGYPWNGPWGFVGLHYGSYGWNAFMHSGWTLNNGPAWELKHWKSLKACRTPRITPVIIDMIWVDTWFENNPAGAVSSPPANLQYENSGAGRVCIDRHMRGVNHVNADGSASWSTLEGLWQLTWNRDSQPMDPPWALPAQ